LLHLCESKSSSSREKKVFSTEDFYGSFQNDTQEDWDEPFMIWKDELDWNKYLIKYYIGREALWIHRRFLFHELIQQPRFHYSETSSTIDSDISPKKEAPRDGYSHQQLHTFLGEEFELIDTCLNVPDTGFEDTTQQKEYAAMYKMWMIMQLQWINGSKELLERIEKERCNLKAMIEKVCPQRAVVWEGLFCLNQCSYVEPH
jgi:protein prenyltransferase alpha subunit repeat containing protein 1